MLSFTLNKNDHFLGNPNAGIILLVYEDFECEYCAKAYPELKKLQKHFKEKICVIYRHFPFIHMHPSALSAALIVEACALQNKFIQAHDLIFQCQEFMEYGLGGILHLLKKQYAIQADKLNADLRIQDLEKKVNEDIESGIRCHVKNTPSIFINGEKYEGAVKFDNMVNVIEEMILKEQHFNDSEIIQA